MKINRKKEKGFTLIELLIVIGITTILASMSSIVYGNLQVSAQLNETSAQIAQNLRLAKEQSIAGLNNAAHGIKFETDQYTLYQGSSYVARESDYDRLYKLDSALSITTTLDGDEIIFSRGVGDVNTFGEINLSHTVNGLKTISISEPGIIQEQ